MVIVAGPKLEETAVSAFLLQECSHLEYTANTVGKCKSSHGEAHVQGN